MWALLLSNLPGIISACIAAIPTLLLAINTIVSSNSRKPLVRIDPAINLLGIAYTALEIHELKAFQRLKLRNWSLVLAFILITYTAIYLFIDIFIFSNYILFLYIGIITLAIFFSVFVSGRLRRYSFFRPKEYLSLGLTSPNVEFVLFRKVEITILADYPYLIAKCYQALKSLKSQTVSINSDDNMYKSLICSSRIAINLIQTEKPAIYKISIEPLSTSHKTNDREETSKSIEALMERILNVPDNYTPPVNLNVRIEP